MPSGVYQLSDTVLARTKASLPAYDYGARAGANVGPCGTRDEVVALEVTLGIDSAYRIDLSYAVAHIDTSTTGCRRKSKCRSHLRPLVVAARHGEVRDVVRPLGSRARPMRRFVSLI